MQEILRGSSRRVDEIGSGRCQTPPEYIVARTENRRLIIMATMPMLLVMMAIIVATGITGALHPSSNGEVIDATTLHLQGAFVEGNLGTAVEPDGSVTMRFISTHYDFVPQCVEVPAAVPVPPP